MAEHQPDELRQLREELNQLQQKLTELNRKLDLVAPQKAAPVSPPPPIATLPPQAPPVIQAPPRITPPPVPPPLVVPPPIIPRPPVEEAPKEPWEVRFGTFWLPRIGMVLLLTGMVFLVTWSYKYMGAAGKVALSYLCCAILGGVGLWLDRKTQQLARVLQAGALALTYFVTYAAHYVEPFRIIHNTGAALALLVLVVAAIIIIADRRKSPALAGLALFFGYFTSVISGVAEFTLASNALLALAAVVFLWRNSWVTISFGAVAATYLTYVIWLGRLRHDQLQLTEFLGKGWLASEDFWLHAKFLSLYWLLFTAGALITRRDALTAAVRNGLLTLNNALFFVLFTMLMSGVQTRHPWRFHFVFAGALVLVAALAHLRFKPERVVTESVFLQGLAVATLGILSYFRGVHLVAALALECGFILLVARTMNLRWIAWIARAAFATVVVYSWRRYPVWDDPPMLGVWFSVVVGYLCTRLDHPRAWGTIVPAAQDEGERTASVNVASLYFACLSTVMAMRAAYVYFEPATLPWVWTTGVMAVVAVGALLRSREIFWMANLPLLWAHLTFHHLRNEDQEWGVRPSLFLILVTFCFGLWLWQRAREKGSDEDTQRTATALLLPYAVVATLATVFTTYDICPVEWRSTAYAAEVLLFVCVGITLSEVTFPWVGLAMTVVAVVHYIGRGGWRVDTGASAWLNVVVALLLFALSERLIKLKAARLALSDKAQRGLRITLVVLLTILAIFALGKLSARTYLTVGWAVCGFALLTFGFLVRERPYRLAGLVTLAFSLLRAIFYDLAELETPYRILSFIGLGAILLVLAYLYAKNREKIAKWL